MRSYLGNLEQLLGDLNNSAQLLDVVNALLDGVGMVGTGSVQDVLLLLNLALSPLLVCGATILGDSSEDTEQTEGGDSLFVEDVELVADRSNGETGTGGEDSGLGDEGAARKSIQDRLGLLLGVLAGDVGGRTGRGEVGSDGRDVAGDNSRSEPGSTWIESVT